MSFIKFENGMHIETLETVKAVDGIMRMDNVTIKLDGRTYVVKDVVIDLRGNELSYPTGNGERTTWRTRLS